MSIICCKYSTGSDTTGNGTYLLPYKTIAKAMSVHTIGDTIGLMDDEPISSSVTIPTYASYLYLNRIIGVNSLGQEDGATRRRLYASTSNVDMFDWPTTNYMWDVEHITFDGFRYVFAGDGALTSHNLTIRDCKFINLSAELSSNLIFGAGNSGTIEDCEFINCTCTNSFLKSQGMEVRNCLLSGIYAQYVVQGSTAHVYCKNIIIANCNYSQYALYGAAIAKNIIVDSCHNRSTASGAYVVGQIGRGEDIIISNCTWENAGTFKFAFVAVNPTSNYNNPSRIAFYNNKKLDGTPIPNVRSSTNILLTSNIISLTESPYFYDNASTLLDYTLKPSFAWRRKEWELGKFRSLLEVVQPS